MTSEHFAELFAPLVQALPAGINRGADQRLVVLATMVAWDDESLRGQVSLDGGDPIWLPAAADTYWPDVVDNLVLVLRNPWTGKGSAILGPLGTFPIPVDEPEVRLARGSVTRVPGAGRVVVSSGGETFTAPTLNSYESPAVGDTVALIWSSDGSQVIAAGQVGAWVPDRPDEPGRPSLTRSGGTVTARWSKPEDVDTTTIRYRYPGGGWSAKVGLTGTSTTLPIAAGRTREVQIRQTNAGGTSGFSESSTITRPASAKPPPKPPTPTYKTVTTTITPTTTGTYRTSVRRWNDWNSGRYGFPNTLYQGSRYGSGAMLGLATYGSKIRDLRAVEILKIEVRLVDAKLGEYTVGQPIRVRLCTNGSRPSGAPSYVGGGITTNLSKGGSKWFDLGLSGTRLDQFRDGDLRGLAIDGGAYRGIRGRGTSGMTLRIKYKRRA